MDDTEEDGVVLTKVDDLIIKSYPDGSTVVIRPDGVQLRSDHVDEEETDVSSARPHHIVPPPPPTVKSESNPHGSDGAAEENSEKGGGDEATTQRPWFQPTITRDQCEHLMSSESRPLGAFIIRESSSPTDLSITVKISDDPGAVDKGVVHVKIEKISIDSSSSSSSSKVGEDISLDVCRFRLRATDAPTFNTLDDFVEYYKGKILDDKQVPVKLVVDETIRIDDVELESDDDGDDEYASDDEEIAADHDADWQRSTVFSQEGPPVMYGAEDEDDGPQVQMRQEDTDDVVQLRSKKRPESAAMIALQKKRNSAPKPHDPTNTLPFHCGYLLKEGGKIKTWKRRWFELHESGQLLYFDKERDQGGRFINSVDINQAQIAPEPHSKRPFCFVIQPKERSIGVCNKRGKYILCASNGKDKQRWLNSMKLAAHTANNRDTIYPLSFGQAKVVEQEISTNNSFKRVASQKPWKPTQKLRNIVSQKKYRFQEKGPSGHSYDLDLTYISERLIAMGYPSDGTEALYRNKYEEVRRMLDDFHPLRYKVYNLCGERSYPPKRFENRVAVFPFDDHCPPPIDMMRDFCEDVTRWLDRYPDSIAAVHCKAGKGRTGLMIAAYLLHDGVAKNADEALSMFGSLRTQDGCGVMIPSQRRYVGYYDRLLKGGDVTSGATRSKMLHSIMLSGIPLDQSTPLYVTLTIDGQLQYSSKEEVIRQVKAGTYPTDHPVVTFLTDGLEISGDVSVAMCEHNAGLKSDEEQCVVKFNVAFSPGNQLTFDKENIDDPHKRKFMKRCGADFEIILKCSSVRQSMYIV